MSLLKTLATDTSIADEKDVLGGGGVVDSGLYLSTIALAYLKKADSGALALCVTFKTDSGKDVRQTLWMTSGQAKGCKNYYEKDGEKHYLPGFVQANALALLTCGKEISQLDTETKVINLYSSEAKAEVPTKVEMVMDLLGKEVIAGIIKQTVDKTVKDASGAYVPNGETREENELDKLFRARDKMTTAEIRAQAEEAVFIHNWEAKWAGKVRDKAKGASGTGTAGAPGKAPGAATAGTKKPTTSLFA